MFAGSYFAGPAFASIMMGAIGQPFMFIVNTNKTVGVLISPE